MLNTDEQQDTAIKPSMMGSKRVMIGIGLCIGLVLLSVVVLIVVSLIPVFFDNTASSTTTNTAKESDVITNTYASNLNISSTDDTTVSNMADVARQLETTTGVSSNSININSIQLGSSSDGRRRRHDLQHERIKRQTLQCGARALAQTFASIVIKLTITYPKSCGISQTCKKNFLTKAQKLLASYITGFPLSLKFADGRTVNTQIMFCNSVIDSSSSSTTSNTTSGTSTTTTTLTTTTTYRSALFEQQALSQTNIDRTIHCAPALTIDENVTAIAINYAQKLCDTNTFAHSGNTYQGNSLGENLWAISSSSAIDITTINGSSPVTSWYNEVSSYNFLSPGFASNTGHFTQLVWKSTTVFGIGICCIADRTKCTVVANYYPAGNYAGQFPQEVLQPSCSGK
ncbi:hypothetical protein I4U23_022147 [Adineta vaga]|nr:hypothetical protein I4U23_022147 [Adineta vaga]